jgi:hypothetical protein
LATRPTSDTNANSEWENGSFVKRILGMYFIYFILDFIVENSNWTALFVWVPARVQPGVQQQNDILVRILKLRIP